VQRFTKFVFVLAAVLPLACSVKESRIPAPTGGSDGAKPKAVVPASFALASEPVNAVALKDVLANSKNGDDIVVVGRVGEAVAGISAFTLVDASLKPCNEMSMPDSCKTPWDYCCTPPEQMRKLAASVELREGGKPIAGDLLGWNGVDHLKTVVVKGKAERDSAGNLTVAASGVFVRK
jgi:hypothetical protein